mgnify:CR=1 FL=1
MEHWRGLFGASIFDADYDAYVQDPRAVTERLLAFLGLDWHEGCLEFQKNATRVQDRERRAGPGADLPEVVRPLEELRTPARGARARARGASRSTTTS